jgi:hypothetical protein
MKLFPEGKSKALSAGALAAAAVCAVMSVIAGRDLLTLLDVFSTPAFYLGLARATLPVELPPLAAFMVRHMRVFFVFSLLFWLSGLAVALGVWARKEWGRQGGCWMLYLVSAAALLLLVYPWLAIPKPLMYGGVSLAPEFNSAVRVAAFFARIASLAGGGLCLWAALALDRGPLRREFV